MKWIGKQWRLPVAVIGAIIVLNLFYPCMWFADGTRGTVVDARNGQPVANAVVSVTWLLDGLEGYPVGWLESYETTTDEHGEFSVPGFMLRLQLGDGRLAGSEPNIRILAPGYVPLRESGPHGGFGGRLYAGASFDGDTFNLQAFSSVPRGSDVAYFLEDFAFVNQVTRSNWRFPLTMHQLDEMGLAQGAY